jgi:hypothetical protein
MEKEQKELALKPSILTKANEWKRMWFTKVGKTGEGECRKRKLDFLLLLLPCNKRKSIVTSKENTILGVLIFKNLIFKKIFTSARVWVLARQVFYHLSHASDPFCFLVVFQVRSSTFLPVGLDQILLLTSALDWDQNLACLLSCWLFAQTDLELWSRVAGIRGMCQWA